MILSIFGSLLTSSFFLLLIRRNIDERERERKRERESERKRERERERERAGPLPGSLADPPLIPPGLPGAINGTVQVGISQKGEEEDRSDTGSRQWACTSGHLPRGGGGGL